MWPPRYAVRDIATNDTSASTSTTGVFHAGSRLTDFHCHSASHEKNPVSSISTVAHRAESSCSWMADERTSGGRSDFVPVPRSNASAADPDVYVAMATAAIRKNIASPAFFNASLPLNSDTMYSTNATTNAVVGT